MTFNDLLELDNSVTPGKPSDTWNRNIQVTKQSSSWNNYRGFWNKRTQYNLRSEANQKSTHYGIQSVRHLGPKYGI